MKEALWPTVVFLKVFSCLILNEINCIVAFIEQSLFHRTPIIAIIAYVPININFLLISEANGFVLRLSMCNYYCLKELQCLVRF